MTDSLTILLTGMSAVLVVLTVLWLATVGLGKVFGRGTALPARGRAKAAVGGGSSATDSAASASAASGGAALARSEPSAQTSETPAGIPPHHLAAISAAVAAMSGGPTRITVRAPALMASAWADFDRFERSNIRRVRFDWPTTVRGPRPVDGPPHTSHDRARSPQQREE